MYSEPVSLLDVDCDSNAVLINVRRYRQAGNPHFRARSSDTLFIATRMSLTPEPDRLLDTATHVGGEDFVDTRRGSILGACRQGIYALAFEKYRIIIKPDRQVIGA